MKEQNLSSRQIMNRIYKDICGFKIPKNDERQVRESKGSPVYGEITYGSLNQLLSFLNLSSEDVFFDLGSGVGKVILYTALTSKVKKAIGVELSTTRYNDALAALLNAQYFDPSLSKRCEFKNDDLMNIDLKPATVIYTCSTAFSLSFMRQVTERLSTFPHSFRLVTLQDLPIEKDFTLINIMRLDMSWTRKTPVYIYQKGKTC